LLGFLILSRAWLGKALLYPLFFISSIIHIFATFAMTLFLILFMFLVIMFIVCFDYILGIARIIVMFMHKFTKRSLLCIYRVSG
jgi:hypothetical protein